MCSIANLLLNPNFSKVTEFRKSANIWQSYERKISLGFFDSQCKFVTFHVDSDCRWKYMYNNLTLQRCKVRLHSL